MLDLFIEEAESLEAPGFGEWATGVAVGVGLGLIAVALT